MVGVPVLLERGRCVGGKSGRKGLGRDDPGRCPPRGAFVLGVGLTTLLAVNAPLGGVILLFGTLALTSRYWGVPLRALKARPSKEWLLLKEIHKNTTQPNAVSEAIGPEYAVASVGATGPGGPVPVSVPTEEPPEPPGPTPGPLHTYVTFPTVNTPPPSPKPLRTYVTFGSPIPPACALRAKDHSDSYDLRNRDTSNRGR